MLQPSFILESDSNINQKITPFPLYGRNYLMWSKVAKTNLYAKGMMGYVSGRTVPPADADSEEYEAWKANDRLVMAWILNSLDPNIYREFALRNSTKELWDSIKATYGTQENLYRVFELKMMLRETRQGDASFIELLGRVKRMWDEISIYRPATTDVATYLKWAEQDKIFELLGCLNSDFDGLVKQILTGPELPSLNTICSRIQREETRMKIMAGRPKEREGASDTSCRGNPRGRGGRSNSNRSQLFCDHCKKSGHARDKCWFLNPHLRNQKQVAAPTTEEIVQQIIQQLRDKYVTSQQQSSTN